MKQVRLPQRVVQGTPVGEVLQPQEAVIGHTSLDRKPHTQALHAFLRDRRRDRRFDFHDWLDALSPRQLEELLAMLRTGITGDITDPRCRPQIDDFCSLVITALAAEKNKIKRGQVTVTAERHRVSRAMDLAVQFTLLAMLERRGEVLIRKRLRLQATRLPRAELTPDGEHDASPEVRAFLAEYQAGALA